MYTIYINLIIDIFTSQNTQIDSFRFRFMSFDDQNGTFLPSEDILLSLALFQLKHVKHSTWFNWNGKYQLISRNFLPNKTVSQIRNHLKV